MLKPELKGQFMGSFPSETKRRIIPRWRTFDTTVLTGELNGRGASPSSSLHMPWELESSIEKWRNEKTTENAFDLVSAGIISNNPDAAAEAAQFLLSDSQATSTVKLVTKRLLLREEMSNEGDGNQREQARLLKLMLQQDPRNSMRWVDLSRSYAVQGQHRAAIKAMETALRLNAENRFVLRSAARLFTHLQEPDRAVDLLTSAEKASYDPWVLAAEIATIDIAGKKPRNMRKAKQIVDSPNFSSFDTAELASAIATLELESGAVKNSRKLFRKSLIAPTENAVAQAEWATTKGGASLEQKDFSTQWSYEAKAFRDYRSGKWAEAIRHATDWLNYEEFSSRPALFGAHIAAIALDDKEIEAKFLHRGLESNPNNAQLLNNYVYWLGDTGQLEKAWSVLKSIKRPATNPSTEAALFATEGFLNFRFGNLSAGRALYSKSIDFIRKHNLSRLETIARIYLAKEEIRISFLPTEDLEELAGDVRNWNTGSEFLLLIERIKDIPSQRNL
ncbi:MAG: hypothetical protein KJZ53_06525 [Anaerolineales bacterium]|nr:hypothetical protein [Anaerolineales bacterium]